MKSSTVGEANTGKDQAAPRLIAYNPSPAELQQLEQNFTYHSPHGDQPERYVQLRDQAKALALRFLELAPPSRERALALTNLEQAVFWVNAAIARND